MRTAVYFVPIITTVIALAFAGMVIARWMDRRQPHPLWWGIGMLTYAAGTITESATTLLGWHEPLFGRGTSPAHCSAVRLWLRGRSICTCRARQRMC